MSNNSANAARAFGSPSWEAISLLPKQGCWTAEDYFRLHTNRMAEIDHGFLEVLPMPTWLHQWISRFLCTQLEAYIATCHTKGLVLAAPLPVKLATGSIREPDVLYFAEPNIPDLSRPYPEYVDLVMEIVSEGPEARLRDYETKRVDYAESGISEYWIVDPEERRITVLELLNGIYVEACIAGRNETAFSKLLPGFYISTDDVFAKLQ